MSSRRALARDRGRLTPRRACGYELWRVLNLNLGSAVDVRYDPYPLAVLRPALDPELYTRLVDSFPDPSWFAVARQYPYKLALGKSNAEENYERFIASNAEWRRFREHVTSAEFVRSIVEFLKRHHIAVNVGHALDGRRQRLTRALGRLRQGKLPLPTGKLSARFEFSTLRADGGVVAPHTDAPQKIITMVLAMIKEGEWPESFGGALDVNRTTDPSFAFNWNNRQVPWDKIEIVDSIPFRPNQCIVFVKTHNSLHSVRKMTEVGSQALRKSVTIVIERDDDD
jgi:hypothetical protein